MSRRGLPGLQRRGARGNGGGRSAALIAPSTPSIAGAVAIGGTMTITPGAGGGPVDHYALYRDGVSAGTIASPYTYVAADVGPVLTVKAIGPGGASAASNTLTFSVVAALAPTLWLPGGASYLTQVAGPSISAWLDQSGATRDMTQAVGALQPAVGTLNSLAVPDYQGDAKKLAGTWTTADVVADGAYTIAVVVNADAFPNNLVIGSAAGAEVYLRTVGTGIQAVHVGSGGVVTTGTITLVAGSTYVVIATYSALTLTLYAAGTNSPTAATDLATHVATWTQGLGVDLRLGEVLVRNTAFSANERATYQAWALYTYAAAP